MFSVHDIYQTKATASTAATAVYISSAVHKRKQGIQILQNNNKKYTAQRFPSFVESRGWKNETHERETDAKCIVSCAMGTMYSENVRGKKCDEWRESNQEWERKEEKKQFHSLWQKHGIMCIIRSVEHTLPSTERKTSHYKENQTYSTRTTIDS